MSSSMTKLKKMSISFTSSGPVPVMYRYAFYVYLKYCRSVLSIICLYKVLLCTNTTTVENELI